MGEKGSVRRLWRNLIEFLEEKRKGRPSLKSCFERGAESIYYLAHRTSDVCTHKVDRRRREEEARFEISVTLIRFFPILLELRCRVAG